MDLRKSCHERNAPPLLLWPDKINASGNGSIVSTAIPTVITNSRDRMRSVGVNAKKTKTLPISRIAVSFDRHVSPNPAPAAYSQATRRVSTNLAIK